MSSDHRLAIKGRLLLARKSSNLTQLEVAEEIGRTRQWVAKIENEKAATLPDALELAALCTRYGVTPSWILFGVASMPALLRRIVSAPTVPQVPLSQAPAPVVSMQPRLGAKRAA